MQVRRWAISVTIGALASGLALPTWSSHAAPLAADAVASWPLDEASGAVILDDSGNGHTGMLVSGPGRVAGKVGGALSFRSGSYVSIPDIVPINGAAALTLSAWIKRSSTNAKVLIGKQASGHDVAIEAWDDGRIYFDVSAGSYADGYVTLNDTAWHHLALVYDGRATGNTGRLKGYVDGTLRTLTYEGTVPSRSSSVSMPFYLGRLQGDSSSGQVDEVRLYDRALTTADIGSLAAGASTSGGGTTTTGPTTVAPTTVAPTTVAPTTVVPTTVATTVVPTTTPAPPTTAVAPPTTVASPAGSVAFPLSVSSDGRYIVDSRGVPFRIQGDAAWSLISNLTYAEADQYLTDRKARGFNTVLVNLIEHKFAVNAPANRNGDQPFSSAGNFSTPTEKYFAFADSIIDLAASKGIAVMLTYAYLGSGGGDEGWTPDLGRSVNTNAVMTGYGQYLGNRYKNRTNIIWVAGGDNNPAGTAVEPKIKAALDGIKAAGATQLVTGHWSPDMISTDEQTFASSMTLNAAYNYSTSYVEPLSASKHTPAIPAFLFETGYEDEGWIPGDRTSIRGYQWQAALSGTGGAFFGNRDMWEFSTDTFGSGYNFGHQRWQLSLGSPGAQDMTRLGSLFQSLSWWKLVPATTGGMRTLITSGGSSIGSGTYVTAAAATDGTLLVAYVPPTGSRTITVDLSVMSGPARTRWYSPATGQFTTIATAQPNATGTTFTTPGDNGANANDWVLIIDR